MERRTFLKLGAAIAGAVALPLSMGNKTDPGCSANNSQSNEKKHKGGRGKKAPGRPYKPGHPGRPLPKYKDDGKRYICTHPQHRSPGLVIFGTEAMLAHIKRYPRHRVHIRPY